MSVPKKTEQSKTEKQKSKAQKKGWAKRNPFPPTVIIKEINKKIYGKYAKDE